MKKTITIAKKFNAYQKVRFPMIILGLSLLPAVLSSAAVVSAPVTMARVVLVVVASIAYLLHIRVIDEHRDHIHDSIHHPTRPVQVGLISREELRCVDVVAVIILLAVAVFCGWPAVVVAASMLAYSYAASHEFFLGEKLRGHFFVYNAVNLLQMIVMQIFVYTVFANSVPIHSLVVAHFLFTTVGTIVFEFIRKLKVPGEDGTGRDTYTWYLGFKNAMIVYIFLAALNVALFVAIVTMLTGRSPLLLALSAGGAVVAGIAAGVHMAQRTHRTDTLMQLSFLLMYGIFNITIFLLAR